MIMKSCERAVARLGKSGHDAFRRGDRPLSCTGVQRRSFRDAGHLIFYASATKRQKKTGSRLTAQADRLKELSGQLRNGSEEPGGGLAAVVSELVELNAALSEVLDDSSCSSSSSESDEDCREVESVAILQDNATEADASALTPLASRPAANNIVAARLEEAPAARLSVCQGKTCSKRGAQELLEAARREAEAHGRHVAVFPCKCLDQCRKGPNVSVRAPGGRPVTLNGVKPATVPSIVRRVFAEAAPVE